MNEVFGQRDYALRMEWGPSGAVATAAEVAVVVDVLSFTTSVTVAVERGMRVFPFRWKDERAAEFAANHDAVLAVHRMDAERDGQAPAPSLSPSGLMACDVIPRVILPSPNGSTIAAVLEEAGTAQIAAGCLRNASAVGRWLAPHLEGGRSVAVIAGGERWKTDGTLRPALEDHLGAGAIIAATLAHAAEPLSVSPEASAAMAIFESMRGNLAGMVAECASGRELIAGGYGGDVAIASEYDHSEIVPALIDGAFELSR